MPDLVKFLRDRIDEDEAAARAAASVIPDAEGWYRVAQEAIADPEFARLYGRAYPHISRWDPARVLAEIKAKRDLIGLILAYESKLDYESGCCHSAEEIERGECRASLPAEIPALRALAQPYDKHPGFDPSWASDA